jgi:Protein of unknown function (DUF4056)
MVGRHQPIEPASLPMHLSSGGERGLGLIYTRAGGLIDLGHLYDLADATKYHHDYLLAGRNVKGSEYPHSVHITRGEVVIDETIDPPDFIKYARSMAFDDSVYHEIEGFDVWADTDGFHNSSFSPEDLPSNHFGTWVGARALQLAKPPPEGASTPFSDGVHQTTKDLLTRLGAVSAADTQKAIDEAWQVLGWFNFPPPGAKMLGEHFLLRRNFTLDPIRPWTVPSFPATSLPTDVTSSVPSGTDYPGGVLQTKYTTTYRSLIPKRITITNRGFWNEIETKIRPRAKALYGLDYDKPGP